MHAVERPVDGSAVPDTQEANPSARQPEPSEGDAEVPSIVSTRLQRRSWLALAGLAVAAAGAIGLFVWTPWVTRGVTSATAPARVSGASVPAAQDQSVEKVNVPTAACPNPYGPLPGQGSPRPLPAQVVAELPAAWSSFFTAYVTHAGSAWLLAPRGWLCQDLNGGGSGNTTSIAPVDDPNAQVSVWYTGSYGVSVEAAAPFFPSARKLSRQDFGIAPVQASPPPAEQWYPLSPEAIYFDDPAAVKGTGDLSGGPYEAKGVMIYKGPGQLSLMTCTLPENQGELCLPILDNFLDQEGVNARV
jgi:hypothetical protein